MGQECGELSRGGHTYTKVSVGESRVSICEQLAHPEHQEVGQKVVRSPQRLGLVDQVKDVDHHPKHNGKPLKGLKQRGDHHVGLLKWERWQEGEEFTGGDDYPDWTQDNLFLSQSRWLGWWQCKCWEMEGFNRNLVGQGQWGLVIKWKWEKRGMVGAGVYFSGLCRWQDVWANHWGRKH